MSDNVTPLRRYGKYNVTPEMFVLAWESSASGAEVGRKLGMPVYAVHSRACHYRRAGVLLKPMGRTRVDVASLNALTGRGADKCPQPGPAA